MAQRVKVGAAEITLTLLKGSFDRGVRDAQNATKSLKDRFTRLRAELNTTSGQLKALGAIAGAGYTAKRLYEMGAAVEETASKFATVFGPAAQEVNSSLAQVATLSGLSNQQMQELTATTGAMVQGMGFSQRASAALSIEMQKLAADLGSFNNIPVVETTRAIQAALTGEREQLKRLGIVVRETDVQMRAMQLTRKQSAKELSNQEKALATYQLIVEQAGVAMGDLNRTSDTAAARMRVFEATVTNIRDRIASALLPVMSFLVERFQSLIQWIELAGAGAAVFMGHIDLLIARLQFWDKEGIQRATESLAHLKTAFAEVDREIYTGAAGVQSYGEASANMATVAGEVGRIIPRVGGSLLTLGHAQAEVNKKTLLGAGGLRLLVDANKLYQLSLTATITLQDRLNASMSKTNALMNAFGFLERIPGLGFLSKVTSPLGLVSGGLGSLSGLLGAFGGGKASGGPVSGGTSYLVGERGPELFVPQTSGTIIPNGGATLTIRIADMSNNTVQLIRSRLDRLENLDVPVVL